MMFMNRKGFTVIELLLVLFIVGLLVSMSWAAYIGWQKQVQVINATAELKSTLLRAQQLAVSASGADNWGVQLVSDGYILFRGSTYNASDPSNLAREFNGVEITNFDSSLTDGIGGYSSSVIFQKLSGQTINIGNITLVAQNSPSVSRQIIIKSSGKVE